MGDLQDGRARAPLQGAPRRPRRSRFIAAALLFGSLLALATAEVGLRVAGVTSARRRHSRPGHLVADPELGWTPLPGYRGVQVEPTYETPLTMNEAGYRGAPWAGPRAAAETRVLALGDSATFGLGVRDEETYPAQLEAACRGQGRDAAVFNAGVSGYDSWQELVVLRRVAPLVRPQVVVIAWLANDATRPYTWIRDRVQVIDGDLVEDVHKYREWRAKAESPWRSALWGYVSTRWKVLRATLERKRETRPSRAPGPITQDELAHTQRGVAEIIDETRRLGATPLVVLFPAREDVFDASPDRSHFDAMRAFLDAHGVEVLDLPEAWHAAPPAPAADLYLPGDTVHFTARGYRAVADAVLHTAALCPAPGHAVE